MKSKQTRLRRCLCMALSVIMSFLGVFLTPAPGTRAYAAQVERGGNIPYNRYLPGATYSTHWYTVDGRSAYCIESEKQAVESGSYASSGTLDYTSSPMLVLALYYGYGGGGAWQMKKFFEEVKGIALTDEQQYLYTHIVANYAFVGANMSSTPGQFYKGLSAEIAEAAGINDWIRFIGRVLGGDADYSGQKVAGGYVTAYDTSTQKLALMGEIRYRSAPTPPADVENVGKVTVTKTGESLTDYANGEFIWEEKGLKGAKFSVIAANDIVSKGETKFEKDAVVGSFETNEDGIGSLDGLYPGEYLLTEDEAPAGYVAGSEPVAFSLSKDGTDVSLMSTAVTVKNERKKLNLNLSKKDKESGNPLNGAKFGLYTVKDILSFDGRILVNAGELLKEATSGANGAIDFGMDLPMGEYEIKEINAPYGYILTGDTQAVVFDGTAAGNMTVKHEFTNAPAKGKLVITKEGESLTGFENGEFIYANTSLSGAEFDLFRDGEEEPCAHLVTDENGNASADNLNLGTYRLVETKAPYGMTLNDTPTEIVLEYANQTTPVVIKEKSLYNEREKVFLQIEKCEKGSNRKLSGGSFGLYTKEEITNVKGEVIVPKDELLAKTEAKDGEVKFELDLPHGEYYVRELEAVPGYRKSNEIYELNAVYGQIPEDGIKATIYNTRIVEETPPTIPETPKKVLSAKKNNYITEDEGGNGYSVLIKRETGDGEQINGNANEETKGQIRRQAKAGINIAYGSIMVLIGGGLFIGRIMGKKKESGEDEN